MKTQNTSIIEALFSIKFNKELQSILKEDIKALRNRAKQQINPNQIAL